MDKLMENRASSELLYKSNHRPQVTMFICRLTPSASELSGFTCTSLLTMSEKFCTRPPSVVLKISSSLLVNECR